MSNEEFGKAGELGEGLLSILIDLLPDYFYVSDSDMRVVYVNKTAADYFGLPKNEIVGKKYSDIAPDKEFARRFIDVGRQIMATGGPRVSDFGPYTEPDGTLTYYRRYDIPFRHPVTGELMLMGLAQDMTDRVVRESQERRIAEIHREMEIAQEIQRSLLPKALRTDWIDLSGFSVPAAYAGGDFYDWLRVLDGSVVLALGDVSGNGVGPALVAAQCQAYWRVLATTSTVRDAVMRLNELILDDPLGDRFVTLAAAKLSVDGTLEIFSAAHGPQILLRSDRTVELLDSHTLPLGVTSELLPTQEVTIRQLAPGDTLLMFSDGVTDVRNPEGQPWNTKGLLKSLDRHHGICGSELLTAIDRDNLGFAAGQPPDDDRTVVVVTFRGKCTAEQHPSLVFQSQADVRQS
jgi:PAS domain S-box-containing protein